MGGHEDIDPDPWAVTFGGDGTYLHLGCAQSDPTDRSYLRVPLHVDAEGLAVRATLELNGCGGWVPGLIAYIDDLAVNFRGWDGEKSWRDDSGAVAFAATHNRMNTVALAVRLRPAYGYVGPGAWQADVVVPIEPGALSHIASEVRSLFRDARGM